MLNQNRVPVEGRTMLSAYEARTFENAMRAQRARHFAHDYLADLGWTVMRDLETAGHAGRALDAGGADFADPVAAERVLRRLEADGLVERRSDPFDVRREIAILSPFARLRMADVFEGAALAFNAR